MAAFLDGCRFNPTAGGTTDWTYSSVVPGYQSPAAANAVNGRLYKYRAESADLSQWELGEGAYNSSSGTIARTTVLFNSSGTTSKINFSTVPQVAAVALTEDLLSVEQANSFSTTQQAQARSNLYATPFDALAYNGVQVNGNVDVSQELATTGATLASGAAKYIADCIQGQYIHGAGIAVIVSTQLAAASFPSPLSGYAFGHQLKATTALSSPAAGDYALHRWIIEGYRISRLGFGASGAQPFSYGFQFYSTVSGTAFVRFASSGYTRLYYQEQTVAAGWNWLTGTIPGDSGGSWNPTTGVGLYVEIFSAGKETTPIAPGGWTATNKLQTTNSTNLLGANNNQTIATGLIVVPGTEIPNSSRAPFIMRPYDQEIITCQRYFETTGSGAGGAAVVGSGFCYGTTLLLVTFPFKATKRTVPAMIALGSGSDYSVYRNGANNAINTLPSLESASVVVAQIRFTDSTAPFTGGQGAMGMLLTANANLMFNSRL